MRRITGILAGLFLALGMVALLYNPLSTWVARRNMDQEIASFEQVIQSAQVQPSEEETEPENAYQRLLEEMQRYNGALYESGQSGLTDAWSCEQAAFDFTEYGLSTEVMGVLRIPAMGQELPVYLGATEANMAKGVAVLGQTSMPVGGINTNCVIVGHRGYKGTAFFRDIEKLQPGDCVYLSTYWGEKTYTVESTAVILPDDLQAVLIQEGRELLTLVTCHPYAVGTHRYVVYCTASEDETSEGETLGGAQSSDGAETQDVHSVGDWERTEGSSSQSRIQLERWLPFLAIPLVILSMILLIWPQKRKKGCQGRREERDEKNTP